MTERLPTLTLPVETEAKREPDPDNSDPAAEREDSERSVEKAAAETGNTEPPDGGYGWVCTAASFCINANTWGINSSYAVFLSFYLENKTYPGASSLEYAFIGGLSISQALLVAPVATVVTRVFGTKITLLLGVFLQALALISASFTHQIWQLILSQGFCFGYGMGLLFVGSVGVIPQWFTKKRSLANGIGTAGSGIGGMMYSLATDAMLKSLGFRWAFRILGIVSCIVNFICALLLKDRNKAIGSKQLAFDYRMLAKYEFWLLLGWGFFSMMGYIVLLFSLPTYAVSIGLSKHQGAVIGALLSLGQGIGRPIVGIFSDAAGRINMAGVATFLAGLYCFVIWIFAKSYGVIIFFAIIVGMVSGTFWTTIAPVGVEVVGLENLPSALSIVWIFLVPPTTVSEPIALRLRQKSGNIFLHPQIYAGFMYIGAALCMWLLRAWKVGQLEMMADEQLSSPEKTDSDTTGQSKPHCNASAISYPNRLGLVGRLVAWKKV